MAVLKFHSSLHKYVTKPRLKVSLNSCDEVINYLKGTQPKLAKYINRISTGKTVENLMLCNSKGKVITREEYVLKKPADDETLHIVPCVFGGGGKFGRIIIGVALVALALSGAIGPALPALLGTGGAAPVSMGLVQSLVFGIGVSLTMGGLSQLFTKTPKAARMENKFDGEARRENDMFGALQNTTDSGTPIPLVYGNMRIAGQLISGYLDVSEHGKNDTVSVSSSFA